MLTANYITVLIKNTVISSTTYSYKTYCQQTAKEKDERTMLTISLKIPYIFFPSFFTICANHNLLLQLHHHHPFTTAQNVHSCRSKENAEIFHTSKTAVFLAAPASFIGHWGHKLCATKQNFTTILVYKCAFFVTTISHTVLLFTRLGHHAFVITFYLSQVLI